MISERARAARYRNRYGKVIFVHEFGFQKWGAASMWQGQPVYLSDCFTLAATRAIAEDRLSEMAEREGWDRV